ncbi:hypothetical protein [Streptomyces syringium]|uniref:hypothetical protein n=1 Tax=Streptomyces syringium TaxID=76729 RepID=UPI003455423C
MAAMVDPGSGSRRSGVYGFLNTEDGLYWTESREESPASVRKWNAPELVRAGRILQPRIAYSSEPTPGGILGPSIMVAGVPGVEGKAGTLIFVRPALMGRVLITEVSASFNVEEDFAVVAGAPGSPEEGVWFIFYRSGTKLKMDRLILDDSSRYELHEGKESVDLKVEALVHAFNSGPETVSVLFRDLEGNLKSCPFEYGTTTYGGSYKEVVDLGVGAGARATHQPTARDNGHCVYTLHDDETVWVSRRLEARPGRAAPREWTPPVPLFREMAGIESPAQRMHSSILFLWDNAGGHLRLASQDHHTNLWHASTVRTQLSSSEQPEEVIRYRIEVTIKDKDGIPLPNHRVHLVLAPDASVCEAHLYGEVRLFTRYGSEIHKDRLPETEVVTDYCGNITLSILPDGLAAPELEIWEWQDAKQQATKIGEVNPGRSIQEYFAGNKSDLNAASLGGALPVFDEQGHALMNARVQTSSGATYPLIPDSADKAELLGVIAAGCRHLAQKPATTDDGTGAVGFRATLGQEVSKYGSGLTWYPTHDSLFAALGEEAAEAEQSNVWLWAEQTAGDVWEAIRNGTVTITEFFVDAATKAVRFVVNIAEQAIKLAVRGFEKTANFITGVIKEAGAAVDDVIEWLSMLFDFKAIWRTKKALDQAVSHSQEQLGTIIEGARTGVHTWFESQKDAVKDTFAAARREFRDESIATVVGGTEELQALEQFSTSSISSKWMHDKVFNHLPASLPSAPALSADAWEIFKGSVEAVAGELAESFGAFGETLKAAFENPKNLTTEALPHLLDSVEHFILAALNAGGGVASATLTFLSQCLETLRQSLNAELELGPINTLWRWIATQGGDPEAPLTITALSSLLAAFPITITYKLIVGVGQEPFPTGTFPHSANQALGASGDPGARVYNPSAVAPQPHPQLGVAAGALHAAYLVPVTMGDFWEGSRRYGMIVTGTQWCWANTLFMLRWHADGSTLPEKPSTEDYLTLAEQLTGSAAALACVVKSATTGVPDIITKTIQTVIGSSRFTMEIIKAVNATDRDRRSLAISDAIVAFPDVCAPLTIDAVKTKTAGWSLIAKGVSNLVCYTIGGAGIVASYSRRLNPKTNGAV